MPRRSNRLQGRTQTEEDSKVNKLPRSRAAPNQNRGGGEGSGNMPSPLLPEAMAMMEEQNQLLETIVNNFAAQGSQGNQRPASPPPQNNRILDMFKELHCLNTSEFGGCWDFIEADYWLREVDMKLDCVRADEKDRVTLAVLFFKGQALFWWDTYCKANPDAPTMVWDEFVRVFKEKHILRCFMGFKKEEFISLRQGGMTVTEYLHKFTELSRYAPEYVNTDQRKKEAFLRGLNPGLKIFVDGSMHADFNALVNKAIGTEIDKKSISKQHKRKFESHGRF